VIDRVERLTNLVALLLTTSRPLTLQEIADRVPGYPEGHQSCRRQFERDKEMLRREGVPIGVDVLDGEHVYRIRPDEYYLAELDLTDEERVALNVAVAAVQLEGDHGREALLKLGGLERSEVAPLATLPALPALPDLFDAHARQAPATFTYQGAERTVDPYALVAQRGHWYVMGRDHLRDDVRTFRVDRIEGDVVVGAAGAYERPAGFRREVRREWRLPGDEPVDVRVLVDAVAAAGVVTDLGEEAVEERRDTGEVVVRLTVTNRPALRTWVLGLLDHAEVLSPADVRAEVVAWLRAVSA
jgi:proteasome accessory factor B